MYFGASRMRSRALLWSEINQRAAESLMEVEMVMINGVGCFVPDHYQRERGW